MYVCATNSVQVIVNWRLTPREFVARGFSGKADQLVDLIKRGIQHPGFSLVDIFQPCVTFNKINTFKFYFDSIYSLQDDPTYTAADRKAALEKALQKDKLPVGLFYQNTKRPSYASELSYLEGKPLLTASGSRRNLQPLFKEFI